MCQLSRFSILVFFLCGVSFQSVFAAELADKVTNYKPLATEVHAEDKILIRGFAGSVKLLPKEGSKQLVAKISRSIDPKESEIEDDWSVTFNKKGKTVEVVVSGPASKLKWSEASRKDSLLPKYNLTITSPSLSAEIFLDKGNISVFGWKAPVKIYHGEGQLKLSKVKSDVMIFNSRGKISVSDHEGALDIETYQGKVSLNKVKGRVELENFSGSSKLGSVEGSIFISTYKGKTSVDRGKGKIQFENGRSDLKVSQFNGDLRGSAKQGKVTASLVGKTSVRIKSEEGAVSLRLPGSGASVNLGSKEGYIHAPKFLELTRLPNLKLIRGRLRGSQSGQVHVRTTSGNIRIR